jgi:hypothetical protein
MPWGPSDIAGALAWWEETFVDALVEMRGIENAVLLVSMEDLVARSRLAALEELFNFVGEALEPRVREYFDLQVSGDRAHIGRWRRAFSLVGRRSLNQKYNTAIERINGQFPSVRLKL